MPACCSASSQTLNVRRTRSRDERPRTRSAVSVYSIERVLAVGHVDDVGDPDLDAVLDRQRLLGVLRGDLQLLEREGVVAQVDACARARNSSASRSISAVVEVVAAEEGVAAGREHLEDVLADLEHRDVEGAAAEVVDGDLLVQVAAEAVGERRRGGLVQDPQHLEAGDARRRPCVAWRWLSLKYAGTVTTAFATGWPSRASAIDFISLSTIAEISGRLNTSSRTWMRTLWFSPSTIWYEQIACAFFTSSEKK